MFTPKASSEQKWVKRTQKREIGDAVTVHRTTMECAEKHLFAIGNIVVRFPASYYDGIWTTLREQTGFTPENLIFTIFNPNSTETFILRLIYDL